MKINESLLVKYEKRLLMEVPHLHGVVQVLMLKNNSMYLSSNLKFKYSIILWVHLSTTKKCKRVAALAGVMFADHHGWRWGQGKPGKGLTKMCPKLGPWEGHGGCALGWGRSWEVTRGKEGLAVCNLLKSAVNSYHWDGSDAWSCRLKCVLWSCWPDRSWKYSIQEFHHPDFIMILSDLQYPYCIKILLWDISWQWNIPYTAEKSWLN